MNRIDRLPHPTTFFRLAFLAAIALLAASLSGCTALSTFNTLVPRDGNSTLAASSVAYGGGPRRTLDIYRPKDEAAAKSAIAPVVFFIYGGSWNSGTKEDYAFVGDAFASAGFVTVIADYRLVPEVRYPDFLKDNAAALAWTHRNIARFGGDPGRIFVAGHSAGAYDALMLAVDPSLLAGAGSSRRIIKAVAGISGPYDFLPLDVDATREAFRGVKDLPATQPVNLVRPGMPPVFIAAGDADDLVKPRNTTTLGKRLSEAGVRHVAKLYPGIGHAGTVAAIARPFRGRAPVLDDVITFFRSVR